MSEPNATNVVAGSGLLYVAPLGTTLPLLNQSSDANGTLAVEDNLNQLPGGFAGCFNVTLALTDGATP